MHVRDHMRPAPITISADSDMHSALRLLEQHAIRRLPVTDSAGRVLGIVTERDLMLAASHYLTATIDVAGIMQRPVVATTPDTPLTEAALLLVSHKIGGLPVLDDDQRVVGIITESDIFRAFVDLFGAGSPRTSVMHTADEA